VDGRTYVALGITCTLAFGGCAKTPAPPPPPTVTTDSTSTATGGSRERTVTSTATVERVDLANRLVTLRRSQGDTVSVRVGDSVRNLPQVKRGDRVVVVSYESVAFRVLKPGEAKPTSSSDVEVLLAPLGERPRAVTTKETTLVATIVSLDRANQQAVLRGPKGKTVTVNVQNPENFDKVKVGDMVEITSTESVAIDVKPAR
jgi:hypothetical protein